MGWTSFAYACFQNMANGVFFGGKEPFMLPMNEFLKAHEVKWTTTIAALCDSQEHGLLGPPR